MGFCVSGIHYRILAGGFYFGFPGGVAGWLVSLLIFYVVIVSFNNLALTFWRADQKMDEKQQEENWLEPATERS